jgi:pimeloyl-ACP methyl ester carboxylesterase
MVESGMESLHSVRGEPALNNIEQKQIDLPGGTLTYRAAGTGDPLVFLHGLGGNSMSWVRQLETLSGEFRLIAWDAPGYGGSDRRVPDAEAHAEAAAELIDELGIAPVVLVGHSMGGVVAGRLAARRPELLSMLVLSSTFAGKDASPEDPLSEGFKKRIQELRTLDREQFGVARAKAMVAKQAPPEVVRAVAEVAADVNPNGFIDACKMLNSADNRRWLGDIHLPTLILEAAEDRIITKDQGEILAELIPHAERHTQPGVGHAPYLENPEQYNQALMAFIRRHKQPRRRSP